MEAGGFCYLDKTEKNIYYEAFVARYWKVNMNNPFKKRVLTDSQIEAAMAYVNKNIGDFLPAAPSKEWDELAEAISDGMASSDLAAWVGHLFFTPAGLWTMARLKLGLGAPKEGLQWLGAAMFDESCKVLVHKGYPPAAADLNSAQKVENVVDGASTRDGKYHGPPTGHEATGPAVH